MATTKITVNSNGSLRVEGDFEIVIRMEMFTTWEAGMWFLSVAAGCQKTNPFAMLPTKGILNMRQ